MEDDIGITALMKATQSREKECAETLRAAGNCNAFGSS